MATRIIAGAWRGRLLRAPPGTATRPTAQRTRQAVFDTLMHATWGGRTLLDGATVLDAFAGTGAMGLEALSRGAAQAVFMERDGTALAALRANVAACDAPARCRVLPVDVRHPPPGSAMAIVFIDPPYAQDLIGPALAALRAAGWVVRGSLIVSEYARHDQVVPGGEVLSSRAHGPGCVTIWRED